MSEQSNASALLKAQCQEFSRELDHYIMTRYRYKKSAVSMGMSNTVGASRSPVSLYLRFKPRGSWPAKTVVIASIGFSRTNKGEGTAFLMFLTDAAPRYGVEWIGLEQTHDGEDIQGFVKKFGFVEHEGNRNWVVPLEKLNEAFGVSATI